MSNMEYILISLLIIALSRFFYTLEKEMKNKPKLKKSLEQESEQEELVTEHNFHYFKGNDEKVVYTLKIGDKVISVGNEKGSLDIAHIVGFDRITMAKNIVPIIRTEDGKDLMALSTLIPYSDDMYNKLRELCDRNDLSHWNYIAGSWCQLDGEKFR